MSRFDRITIRSALAIGVVRLGISIAILSAFLSGCVPAGLDVRTPLGSIANEHEPHNPDGKSCVVDGLVELPKGSTLICGAPEPSPKPEAEPGSKEAPAAAPTDHVTGPAPSPADDAPAPAALEEISTAPPAPAGDPEPTLLAEIQLDEGGDFLPYCDTLGVHIADGVRLEISGDYLPMLSEAERLAITCRHIQTARDEARRMVGAYAWRKLDDVRRDAWTALCYAAACHGFTETAKLTRSGNYHGAANAMLDSRCPTCFYTVNPNRAEKIAAWLRTGER